MDRQQNTPALIVRPDGTAVTEDGLVMKNVTRIEKFNLQVDLRTEARFLSWQVARIVRRDLNYISSKLVCRQKDRAGYRQVRSLVTDLRVIAEEFKAAAEQLEPNPENEGTVLPIRIVCAESATVYNALRIADEGYHRINHAFRNHVLAGSEVPNYTRDFEVALNALKQILGETSKAKTAQQLGAEQGIV